ncbi:hypothetical protein Leryth_007008 [Lithospermum erythrorhizon]|nr:hypothetical protein Leryth_007008 [Lithospermum erythrorhizon]
MIYINIKWIMIHIINKKLKYNNNKFNIFDTMFRTYCYYILIFY